MSNIKSTKLMRQLLDTQKYSDVKLVCQNQEFNVHKAVVCIQSPVLAAAFGGDYQVRPPFTIGAIRRGVRP